MPAGAAADLLIATVEPGLARRGAPPDPRTRKQAHDLNTPPRRRPRRQPDPLRPLQQRLREGVQPGHADRRARRARRPRSASRASASARSPQARCSSTAATSTSRARACSAAASRPRPPPTTSSRPAAPASRRRSSSPTRSRSARSTPAIAGGVDTTSDAPIALNEDLREVLLEANRAKSTAARLRALAKIRPSADRPRDPAQRGAAHGAVDGRAPGAQHRRVGRHARRAGRARRRTATATSPRPTSAASTTTSSRPTSGSSATRTCAPTRRPRSWPSSSRSSAARRAR